MSRIGKIPVQVPAGVKISINGSTVEVEGAKGKLSKTFDASAVKITLEGDAVHVVPANDSRFAGAMHGTVRAIINNMVKGVSEGYTRKLELIGVGYKAQAQGQVLKLSLGFSHDINYQIPAGVKVATPQPTAIELSGIDKQLLGQVASEIRSYRSPEPYKGKGVKYEEETVLRKVGKKK